MKKRITFIGLDTHKNSIEVALADESANSEVRLYGSIGGDLDSLDKVIRKLHTPGVELRFVYEAGPAAMRSIGICEPRAFTAMSSLPPWSPGVAGIVSRPTDAMLAIWRGFTARGNLQRFMSRRKRGHAGSSPRPTGCH